MKKALTSFSHLDNAGGKYKLFCINWKYHILTDSSK